MQVSIYNHYDETTKTIEGPPPAVEAELLRLYPFLRSENPDFAGDINALVDHLNSTQALEAEVLEQDPMAKAEAPNLYNADESHVVQAMLGYNPNLLNVLDAAKWLAGGVAKAPENVRQALWEADGDPEEAALLAYGLEATRANLKALRAICDVSRAVKAAPEPVQADTVEPGHPDADEAAEQVKRAFDDHFVLPVELGGKHSKGSMLARDHDTGNVWLLKPGSGGEGPSSGINEERASQSRREVAFWHMAEAWGLGGYLPESQLLLIDGKEYAAIKLLSWSYSSMDKIKKQEPARIKEVLDRYCNIGLLHRWGALDAILGQTDRHAGNMMEHDGDVKLIDQGSSFAGEGFNPGRDKNTFTPFYLRYAAPGRFSTMDAVTKDRYMPHLGRESDEDLKRWLENLHAEDLDRVLLRYGVNPQPPKERLAKLKVMMTQMPAHEAVNRFWMGE